MSGVVVIAVGLVLCFLGMRSVHLAVAASGFALGWMLAEAFDATAGTALLIGLGGAVTAWIVVSLVFRGAAFFVGAIGGGVIGSKIYTLLQGEDSSVILAVVFVLALAAIGGFLTNRYRRSLLLGMCAFGGAGIVWSGLATMLPDTEAWIRYPETTAQGIVSTGLWIALGVLGVLVQRRLFARALGADDDAT